jgi:hypothetical protein
MFPTSYNSNATIRVDRRKFLGVAAGLIAAGVLPKNVMALAGPYMFKQGSYDVTVVSDGTLLLPTSIIDSGGKPEEVTKLLGTMVQGDKAQFEASPLLLKSGSEMILMDTGSGGDFQPTAGKVLESHPDHCWGTIGKDGKPIFSKASFHMGETEWNFWTAADLGSKMPKEMQGMVTGTQTQLGALKDQIKLFKAGAEVLPGIMALDTAGHTPGHISFELAGGDGMIVTGDAITNPMVFFAHPDWKFNFDADHATAIANRKKLLDMASAGKKKLLGYHWPYPGIGMAEKKDGAYVYVPQA